jgi:hypothetical protein
LGDISDADRGSKLADVGKSGDVGGWNAVYLNRAIAALLETEDVPDHLLG